MSTDFNIDGVLAELSLPDKIKLLTGMGWWHTEPFPHAHVPSIKLSDGPNGVRGAYFFNGTPANCFPCSTGLASSFDVNLVKSVGVALGDEARAKGVHVLLAPTVNTQRSPLGGRGFESFSEDPHLNGMLAAAYINGLQSKGVSATIKHFVANDQEFERFSISSEVSERALREIYLKPFQIAIKHSNPRAVMSAYNRVNGIHASENKYLLDDVLRKEWGYQGLIMSDWTGTYSTTASLKAGLDLEMPGPSVMRGSALERAVIAQKVSPADIEVRARKVLELVKHGVQSGIPFDAPESSIDTLQTRDLLRGAAADAIVLLKNDDNLLPLTDRVKKIAVIGPNAGIPMSSGGGSARLLATYAISPLEGIQKAAKEIGADVTYTIGATTHKYLPLLSPHVRLQNGTPGALLEFWNEEPSKDFISTSPDFSSALAPEIWHTTTSSTECILMDHIDDKVNYLCWIRFTARFIPNEDGDWELGLNVTGRANLFLNEKLIIDLSTNPKQSPDGPVTTDVRAVIPHLKAGQEYNLEIRLANADFAKRPYLFKYWGSLRLGGMQNVEPKAELEHAVALARAADVTVLVIGLNHDLESEGFDRPDMDLPGLTNILVSEILKANPRTVVVNQTGTPVAMPWVSQASTLIQAFFGGNELGNALADVLFGKVNPSGKLPLTFPQRLEDTPPYPSYGDKGQELGKIHYNEGIFVGYRSYEIRKLAPLFPFGFGLSYTSFEYGNLHISDISNEGSFTVTFTIKNTGNIAGREITQVYISDDQASLPRPVKELKAFTKVSLSAGEMKTVKLELDREALGFYDSCIARWVAEKGTFTVHVAASSSDTRLKGSVELFRSFSWTGL